MKTPLTELLEWVHSLGINPSSKEFDHAKDLVIEKIKALLPKEKEVIVDAFNEAINNPLTQHGMEIVKRSGEKYFNKTFNTEE